jgi:outer membrane receptor protein involved in Fe transport
LFTHLPHQTILILKEKENLNYQLTIHRVAMTINGPDIKNNGFDLQAAYALSNNWINGWLLTGRKGYLSIR